METEKIYWTISEVSEMTGITKSNIRFWEGEFEWFNPKRRNGKRKFTKEDIEILKSIDMLVNELGMTLGGVNRSHDVGYYDELLSIAKYYNKISLIYEYEKEI